MPEILFYQMETRPLERVLPDLLQRSLQRGWRVVVKVGSPERLEELNSHLWSYNDASFLPHGAAADGHSEHQPIWLTINDDNPNGATVRFLVDGADSAGFAEFERTVYLFGAADDQAVGQARSAWTLTKAQGFDVTYWRQGENGRWERQG